jgi:hypothetical protein
VGVAVAAREKEFALRENRAVLFLHTLHVTCINDRSSLFLHSSFGKLSAAN